MSEQERHQALKIALYALVLEGWVSTATLTAKFAQTGAQPLLWLVEHGWLQQGEVSVVRWNMSMRFEDLWDELIPDRPCPMRFRLGRVMEYEA